MEASVTPIWAHLGPLLGRPGAQKCNMYEGVLLFLRIHFYLLEISNVIPRGPQEALKRSQEEPKRGPQGPKRGPRRPQDGPKRALRSSKTAQVASQGLPVMFMTALAAQRHPQEDPRTPRTPPKHSPTGTQERSKMAPGRAQDGSKTFQGGPSRVPDDARASP